MLFQHNTRVAYNSGWETWVSLLNSNDAGLANTWSFFHHFCIITYSSFEPLIGQLWDWSTCTCMRKIQSRIKISHNTISMSWYQSTHNYFQNENLTRSNYNLTQELELKQFNNSIWSPRLNEACAKVMNGKSDKRNLVINL